MVDGDISQPQLGAYCCVCEVDDGINPDRDIVDWMLYYPQGKQELVSPHKASCLDQT